MPWRQQRGFTLIELLFVLALLGALLVVLVPQIQVYVYRGRIEGAARETAALMYRARVESIRRSVPVVVQLDLDANEVFAFADVNDAGGNPVSDLLFNPVAGAPQGGTDYPLGRVRLPAKVFFWGPADVSPEGPDIVDEFSALGTEPNGPIFQSDGSLRMQGAFRFGDERENFLEVRVSPTPAPRAVVRKYDPDLPAGPDGTQFFPPGWQGNPWTWN